MQHCQHNLGDTISVPVLNFAGGKLPAGLDGKALARMPELRFRLFCDRDARAGSRLYKVCSAATRGALRMGLHPMMHAFLICSAYFRTDLTQAVLQMPLFGRGLIGIHYLQAVASAHLSRRWKG